MQVTFSSIYSLSISSFLPDQESKAVIIPVSITYHVAFKPNLSLLSPTANTSLGVYLFITMLSRLKDGIILSSIICIER